MYLVALFVSITCFLSKKVFASDGVDVNVYEFKNCPLQENYALSFDNITMRMDLDTKKLYVNGNFHTSIVWDDKIHFKIIIERCLNKDEASCSEFVTGNLKDMCSELSKKEKPWTGFVEHLKQFTPECPIPIGSYPIEDAPIDTKTLEDMKSIMGYWRVLIEGVDESGKIVSCGDSAAFIKRAKRTKQPADEDDDDELL